MDDDGTLRVLRALADPVRLIVLRFLLDPEPCWCAAEGGICGRDFMPLLGLKQPTVSHHLKQLVEAGLVRAEKRGRWTFYELEPAAFRALRDALAPFATAAR